jgi:predicted membrane-bound spermidine synthase
METRMATKLKKIPLPKVNRAFEFFLLTAFFFSGATSLSLEVAWSKELSYLLGVDIYATTTVVTAFMAGLGLGAVLVARFYKWSRALFQSRCSAAQCRCSPYFTII